MERARFCNRLHIAAEEGQVIRLQFEIDGNGLAWLQAHTPKALQFLDGSGDARHEITNIELHNFVGGDFAAVGQL